MGVRARTLVAFIVIWVFTLISCGAPAVFAWAANAGEEWAVVQPADTGAALINPGMGWTMHYYSNDPANYGTHLEVGDTADWFSGLSTVYLRVPWAMIEPEEGRFHWALLDTPAQRWIAKGKKVAIRITCSENWMRWPTPEWVRNAGAKGTFYEFAKGPVDTGPHWDPDFGDPIFLEKLEHMLAALAARYDGNPAVAFIDIGSFGLWGEGHTFMSSRVPDEKADTIIRRHIDLHIKHFPRTLLCISDDIVGHNKPGRRFPLTDYALSQGVTLRDDSIMVQPPPQHWYHADLAQRFWPKLPIILEHEHYDSAQHNGAWGDGARLLQAVEEYHASYMSIHGNPRREWDDNRSVFERINRRLGYRIQPRELRWPLHVSIGRPFRVESRWANAGVAPCYPGGFMAITLKDDTGGIVSVLCDNRLDMRTLPVGPPDESPTTAHVSEFRVGLIAPRTLPGTYDVFLSVGRRDGTPLIALPLAGDDGQRRYKLGSVTLVKE
jgi:Domain of unknown function (DUF4832)/Beta-galactosidase